MDVDFYFIHLSHLSDHLDLIDAYMFHLVFKVMKSNVKIKSPDREICGMTIPVMSENGFICITSAFEAMSKRREEKGLPKRRLVDIMRTSGFSDRFYELINELINRGLLKCKKLHFKGNHITLSDLRNVGLAKRTGKGSEQLWFLNPYLFFAIALEMDVDIYANVIIWMTDGLVENRNRAGDAYLKMCSSIYTLFNDGKEFKKFIPRVAKGINFIVFGNHEDNIRNSATSKQLEEIISIENAISLNIETGIIKSVREIINFLGNMWRKRCIKYLNV